MIKIEGEITNVTTIEVANQLALQDDPVEVVIDSPGGDLFAGLKIFDMFEKRDVQIKVNRAGSVASIIALAGKQKPKVLKGGGFAIHNAHTNNIEGNHNDLRKVADSLEKYSQIVAKIYEKKTKLSNAQALSLMNDSTMIDSNDSIKLGFASEIIDSLELIENLKAFSLINQLDMSLLKTVMNNLGLVEPPAEPVAPTAQIDEPGAEPAEGAFTPEQLEEITLLVKETVAAALAGTQEEIGNTIAVVLNQVVSNGQPPTKAEIANQFPVEVDAVTAFHKTMNEIKDKNVN